MELDELKSAWAELDRRVAVLEVAMPVRGAAAIVREELRPLCWGQSVQVVGGLLLALGAGSFWFDHRDAAGPLVAGLLLHIYGVSMIIAAARNLVLAVRASEDLPVLALQRRLATLKAWRIREGRWFGIVGCFMWVPMIIWAFAQLGVDIVAARPGFVAWNVVVAVVCLGAYVVVSRLVSTPEGAAVRRARERLEEIARFTGDAPV